MRAESPVRSRRSWRDWRRSRPFWGGLFVLLGGIEIFLTVWSPLPVVMKVGMQNFLGYLIPILIILCGLLLWFNPAQRTFYSLVVIVLSLSSWLTSNMGGFIIGLLLGLLGGSLAFAWTHTAEHGTPSGEQGAHAGEHEVHAGEQEARPEGQPARSEAVPANTGDRWAHADEQPAQTEEQWRPLEEWARADEKRTPAEGGSAGVLTDPED